MPKYRIGHRLFNASLADLVLIVLAIGLLLFRIRAGESHLTEDRAYGEYMDYTRWRLLPLVY